MSNLRTVRDVMNKIKTIHEASSWINHVYAGDGVTPQCKKGLELADELLEEYENILAGMVITGDGEEK